MKRTGEQKRVNQEVLRSAEEFRMDQEQEREQAERGRVEEEFYRNKQETERVLAEGCRDDAEHTRSASTNALRAEIAGLPRTSHVGG